MPSRFVTTVGCSVLAAAFASAQIPKSAYTLEVSLDRPDAIYRANEEVTCAIRLRKDGQPVSDREVTWTFSKDGVAPFVNGKAILKDGVAIAKASLGEPGFLQCRAAFREHSTSSPLTALAGAAIDPLQIKPSLPVPDDFDAFWAAQKKKLAAVPMNPRLTPVATAGVKGVEAFDLQAGCIGAPVSAYLARPQGAAPKSLPAILLVHGAGVVSSSLTGAATWGQRGVLAMNLNAHGIPNGKPASFYKSLEEGALKDYRFAGREDRETCYFLGMFLRLVRAIDVLTSQPEWNGRDVIVYGSSQGGFQAFAAAGIDDRVTFFVAGVPAGCDHTGITVGRVNGWPKLVPNLPDGKPDPRVLQVARYFDNVNFAAHTKAKGAFVTVGFIDSTCPPTSVYAAYNALPIPKQIFNDVKTGHANSPAASKAMLAAAMAIIQRK